MKAATLHCRVKGPNPQGDYDVVWDDPKRGPCGTKVSKNCRALRVSEEEAGTVVPGSLPEPAQPEAGPQEVAESPRASSSPVKDDGPSGSAALKKPKAKPKPKAKKKPVAEGDDPDLSYDIPEDLHDLPKENLAYFCQENGLRGDSDSSKEALIYFIENGIT